MKIIFSILSKFIVLTILIVLLSFLAGYGMSWLKMSKSFNLWFVKIDTIKQVSVVFNPIYTVIVSAVITIFLEFIQFAFKREK